MAKKGKHSVEIYQSWCKRCGICVAFCPAEALAQNDSGAVFVKDPERCTGCQLCELRCPDFAIHVRSPRKREEGTKEKAAGKINQELSEESEKT